MTSPVAYDQLDAAIHVLLTAPDSAVPPLDSELSGLLEVAAELPSLPRPEFRAALENDLRYALDLPLRESTAAPALADRTVARRRRPVAGEPAIEEVLPTLLGDKTTTFPARHWNFALSLAAHAAALALIFTSGAFVVRQSSLGESRVSLIGADVSDYTLRTDAKEAGGGGGGGDRDKLAAALGALPKFSTQQLAPPAAVIRNPDPRLAVEPTVVVPPDIRLPQTGRLGDPLSLTLGPPSSGTGSGGGIGSGEGGGVGSGMGPGVGPGWGGGIGGGIYRVGGGVSSPRAIFAPDPEYSDEARKAKHQGTVVLWAVIGADGRLKQARVQRSLGLGLDEKAIEAVRRWRFQPATKDGQPVAVQVNIEVNFRLY